MNPIVRIKKSTKPGPVTVIMGGVHGNEKTGVEVVHYLNNCFTPEAGTIVLCIANPAAIQQDTRFIDQDLNRICFVGPNKIKSVEGVLSNTITDIISTCDYFLDLHNTIGEGSQPFLINEHSKFDGYFDLEYCVSGLDLLHPGGTDGYANAIGSYGLCLECGSVFEDRLKTKEYGIDAVYNFLKVTGNIVSKPFKYPNPKKIHVDMIYKTRTNKFILKKEFNDFQFLKQGEEIGSDGNDKVYAPYDGYIIFAYNTFKVGGEGFVFGRKLIR